MEDQLEFARLLYGNGHGLGLKKATHDVEVGDICYWTPEGKACKMLNIFDNAQVPSIPIKRNKAH